MFVSAKDFATKFSFFVFRFLQQNVVFAEIFRENENCRASFRLRVSFLRKVTTELYILTSSSWVSLQ
jgi:3'-phosphoadenosine 5'-phosphosulfate sulfotransferase